MQKPFRITFAAFLLILVVLGACQAEEDESSPLDPASPLAPGESPLIATPQGDLPSRGDQENLRAVDQLTELARQDLASELDVDAEDIELVEVESVEWANSSLGCPQEGQFWRNSRLLMDTLTLVSRPISTVPLGLVASTHNNTSP